MAYITGVNAGGAIVYLKTTNDGSASGTPASAMQAILAKKSASGDTEITAGTPADAVALADVLLVNSSNMQYNGATLDLVRSNITGTAIASAAYTSTQNGPDIVNYNGRGVMVFLNVTVASGTGGLSIRIQMKDPISGTYVSMNAAPTAVTATGITTYQLYAGATTGATQSTNSSLPRTFRIICTHGDGSSYTYSVGYSLNI